MFNKITSSLLFVLSLSLFLISCDDDDPVAPSEEHFKAAGFVIFDEDGNTIFKVLNGQVDAEVSPNLMLKLAEGEIHYDIEFLDEDGKDIGVPDDDHEHSHATIKIESEEEHSLLIESKDATLLEIETHEWEVHINPLKVGSTELRVKILHEGHPDFTSPYFPVVVE